jgi:alpha-tubulin suppressor-like RCC1 family protein
VIRKNGHVACFGANDGGQLADGTSDDRQEPTEVPDVDDAVHLALGQWHTCILHKTGKITCHGLTNVPVNSTEDEEEDGDHD